ncbi:aminotransferase class I/II-fold pyridoxal phosphate-dependent enzyme [Francisella frigiditurris]|uniref:Aminotransferase n=1 Tax=Francisella frigiditurris TaxID=1542390 RepID=A0A1J0KW37_9GAMM|nr:aminotransferase class I/II-fold pyridoxal phosphate-dependent enzyme [Francisella frigiditurris]APC97985.1 aminotransferase class-V family protein [Francisella frigiditurris]
MIKAKPYLDTTPFVYGKMATMAAQHNAVSFTQGAPDFDTPEWFIDKTTYYMKKGFNQYAPIPGAPKLRQAIKEKVKICYDTNVDVDNIIITSGAGEAIYAVLTSYIEKGDEVIFFDPTYDPYNSVTLMNQGIPVRLKLQESGKIDVKAIANAITDKTKVIILNSPHNPMGTVISKEEYQEIAKIIKGKDILLFADEVYEHIYAGDEFTSALEIPELRDQLVVFQSLGKTFNLTGWRIGICIAPKAVIEYIIVVKQVSSFSPSHPMQLALADGIVEHPEYYLNLNKIYKKQNALLREKLKNSQFKLLAWEGSPFQILDYRGISDENDMEFCTRLIKEYGVGLIPCSSFYEKPEHGLLRLCFAKKDDAIIKGAEILCKI